MLSAGMFVPAHGVLVACCDLRCTQIPTDNRDAAGGYMQAGALLQTGTLVE